MLLLIVASVASWQHIGLNLQVPIDILLRGLAGTVPPIDLRQKKWERILKWERTANVLYVFKSELVDFEGTFGGVSIQLLVRPTCSNGGVSLLA